MKRDARLIRLSREHTQALMLAQRIERTASDASDQTLGDLYSTLIAYWSAGLLPHFSGEGECLLARLVRHVPIDDQRVLRLHRDHLGMAALIASMRDSQDLKPRREHLLAFAEALRTHVRWEENVLFPLTESVLEPDELDALGTDLATRLPDHPTPYAERQT